VLGQF
jgi:hypothetical protein